MTPLFRWGCTDALSTKPVAFVMVPPIGAAVHWLDGSEWDVNLGSTSDAAPKAASSNTSRYSRMARCASVGSVALWSQSSFGVELCLLASASIKLTDALQSFFMPSCVTKPTLKRPEPAKANQHEDSKNQLPAGTMPEGRRRTRLGFCSNSFCQIAVSTLPTYLQPTPS